MAHSLLFIPDISGFTEFVNRTEVVHGRHVVAELLELVIDSDTLGMTVSEVEGDAVLFYGEGTVPSLEDLADQARGMFEAFHARLKEFEARRICDCGACRTAHTLSLKIVAHAGPIEFLNVKQFRKPFGPEVILAHRLLKNDVESNEYLLVTETLLETGSGVSAPTPRGTSSDWGSWVEGVTDYDDFGPVVYRVLPLSPLLEGIPDPPRLPSFPRTRRPIVRDTFVDRPCADLFELVSNLDLRLLWNPSVDELRYDADRVNRVGTKHFCVIGGDLIEFETVTDDFGEGRRVYGEKLQNPPLVEGCAVFYVMEPEGTGSRLRVEVHYQPKRFPGVVLAPLFRFAFGRRLPGILQTIKDTAEGRLDDEALAETAGPSPIAG